MTGASPVKMAGKDPSRRPRIPGRTGFQIDPRFTDLQLIGHGGNGIVYSAIDSDCDKSVAVKKLSFMDKHSCKYALREVRIMRRLLHENVVTVYEILGPNGYSLDSESILNNTVNISEMSSIYVVQELLHTDLHQLILTNQLTDEHTKLFMYQLLRGLKYIHSANVLHRDLKPSNLLINVEDLVLKIGDFGLARVVDAEYSHKGFLTDSVGTCWYRSPELIISPRDYTKSIDLWSAGCILAEMLTGKPVFHGAHEMEQIGVILDAVYLNDNEWNKITQILPKSVLRKRSRVPKSSLKDRFLNLDPLALDLLEKLLVFNPARRYNAMDALAHPYLQQFSCVEDEPVVLRPFRVEHEVDELSPKTLRRMISNEMQDSVETCGSQNPSRSNNCKNGRRETSAEEKESDAFSEKTDLIENWLENSHSEMNMVSLEIVSEGNQCNRKDSSCSSSDTSEIDLEKLELCPCTENKTRVELERGMPYIPSLTEDLKQLHLVVDFGEEENRKEQVSPKEGEIEVDSTEKYEKEEAESKSKEFCEDTAENLRVENPKQKQKSQLQKAKDILNAERRAESPREKDDVSPKEKIAVSVIRIEKERVRPKSGGSDNDKKSRNIKRERKKKNRNNNRYNNATGAEGGQDFDALYRLPTEHLTRHRNHGKDRNTVKNMERQLRIHEEINERRKFIEFEREKCIGAVGGMQSSFHGGRSPTESEENLHRPRGRHNRGNASPTSEHSRDNSPSNDDPNSHRRFEN